MILFFSFVFLLVFIVDVNQLYISFALFLISFGIFKLSINSTSKGFLLFGAMFYVLPVFVNQTLNSDFIVIGMPTLSVSDNLLRNYLKNICIFFSTFTLGSYLFKRLKFFDLKSNTKLVFSKDFSLVLIILMLLTFFGYSNKIYIIQKIGYQNFHGGIGFDRRGFLEYLAEIFFIFYLQIKVIHKSKWHIVLFILLNLTFLLSGMRMPFFVNIYVLSLFISPHLSTNWRFLLPAIVISVLVLIMVQNFRYGFGLITIFSDNAFLLNSFLQINEIFGYTTELCLAIMDVKIAYTDIGYCSPFYDFIHLSKLITSKFTGNGITILDSIDYGNVGYNTYRYFMPDKFYLDNATFGGSNIGEVYFFFGVTGVWVYGLLMAFIVYFLDLCRTSKNNYLNLLFFIVTPFVLRSFRDGYLSWFVNSLIMICLYTFFVILTRKIKVNG